MKFRTFFSVFMTLSLSSVLSLGLTARAEETVGTTNTMGLTSLQDQMVSFQPQIGLMSYDSYLQGGHTDLTLGGMVDMNILKNYNPLNFDSNRVMMGPSIGLFFSHLTNPTGGNFYSVPMNAKVGYMITDNLRIGAHGGGNFAYRSTGNSMRLSNNVVGPQSTINLLPNLGADLDYAFGQIAISARPDITFTSGSNIFTGTVAVLIPMG